MEKTKNLNRFEATICGRQAMADRDLSGLFDTRTWKIAAAAVSGGVAAAYQ